MSCSCKTKTLFTRNVYDSEKTVFKEITTLKLENTLKRIILELIQWIGYYLSGDLERLTNELTLEKYNTYSRMLFTLKKGNGTDEELVRNSITATLSTLFAAKSIYEDCQTMEKNNKALKEKVEILEDMDKLREYLEVLRKQANTDVFGTHDVSTVSASVKQEYIMYIREHGYPNNGVFDPDLLGMYALKVTNG